MPPIYPLKKANNSYKGKGLKEAKISRGETIRAAAQRSVFENNSYKRFNSSNGIRNFNRNTQETDDEEEKVPGYSKIPLDSLDNKLAESFADIAHKITGTNKKEVMIKAINDPDIENDWTKAVNNTSTGKYLHFRPYIGSMDDRPVLMNKNGYNFRFFNTDVKIVRYVLEDNGFRENNNLRNQDWMLMWSTCGYKSDIYQILTKYQKINHFPRSTELTRKDCMYSRMARMKAIYGEKAFNFIPETFILPKEYGALFESMSNNPNQVWIVKPSASSQGKGIFLTSSIDEINAKVPQVVCRYIENPLLFNGFKFDLRVYVAITSICPLRLYVYREGLARLATIKYDVIPEDEMTSKFTHLTNYSINKFNPNFKVNEGDNEGGDASKVSFKDTNAYLEKEGIDTDLLWRKIEDLIIKTILGVEPLIANGMDMFVPFKTNWFELLGFDILIDQNINPWLLEVNLSPSMNWDSAFDQLVKSNLLSDLFTLIGVQAVGAKILQQSKKRKSRFNSLAPISKGLVKNKGLLKSNFISKRKQQEFNDFSNKNENINTNDESEYTKEEKRFIPISVLRTEDSNLLKF